MTYFQDHTSRSSKDQPEEYGDDCPADILSVPTVKAATVVGLQSQKEGEAVWVFNENVHLDASGMPMSICLAGKVLSQPAGP